MAVRSQIGVEQADDDDEEEEETIWRKKIVCSINYNYKSSQQCDCMQHILSKDDKNYSPKNNFRCNHDKMIILNKNRLDQNSKV